jgi:alanyl aminopeptidase
VTEPIVNPPVPDEPTPPPEAPALRLPSNVLPIEYRAELTIDSSADQFSGVIDIDINILERTDHIWLNATDITVNSASLLARGQTWPIERLPTSNEDFLGFGLGVTLPASKATLHIEYTGKISDKDYSGIFKQKENDHWYVYTQFESTSARRAFPCFDEPRFKVPWQLAMHVKESDLAFTNTPQIEDKAGPSAGMKTYRFAQSKPLPSYLVAMAVGPFEIVDLGKIGRNQTPARILVPQGRTAEARFAAEATPTILQLLEDYFDMPYPYAKLDSIAIPHFFGAMENPGLITYNSSLLLSPPDDETIRFKRGYASVGAHEIAHQWFGNLVTLDWWDDIWLNESFATWMSHKIVAQWRPEWRPEIHKLDRTRYAMYQDSLVSARQIRQPIVTKHDIASAFDSISYAKGSAVLSMFERWIGEDRFRDGVRAYMTSHAWDTATAEDFLAAISKVGQPPRPSRPS